MGQVFLNLWVVFGAEFEEGFQTGPDLVQDSPSFLSHGIVVPETLDDALEGCRFVRVKSVDHAEYVVEGPSGHAWQSGFSFVHQ